VTVYDVTVARPTALPECDVVLGQSTSLAPWCMLPRAAVRFCVLDSCPGPGCAGDGGGLEVYLDTAGGDGPPITWLTLSRRAAAELRQSGRPCLPLRPGVHPMAGGPRLPRSGVGWRPRILVTAGPGCRRSAAPLLDRVFGGLYQLGQRFSLVAGDPCLPVSSPVPRLTVSTKGRPASARALYRACDIVYIPTAHCPTPWPVLCALAAGRPLVVAAADNLSELVVDGSNGLVVEPEQPAAATLALASLISRPDLAADLAGGAWEAAGALTWDRTAAEIDAAVGRILAGIPPQGEMITQTLP